MTYVYNYVLGFDTENNQWFHNTDAEGLFFENDTVHDTKNNKYINEYKGNEEYLGKTEELITLFNNAISKLNGETNGN